MEDRIKFKHERKEMSNMENQLTRVIDAIKQDPHGKVARNVCHWLAVEVMGRKCIIDPLGQSVYEYYIDTQEYVKRHENVGDKKIYSIENKIKAWMPISYWQPFTDANHTRMLVIKVGVRLYDDGLFLAGYPAIHRLDPYSDNTTHDACQVMRKCHADGTLTDDILKGFLG
jgi:hypothetical protein